MSTSYIVQEPICYQERSFRHRVMPPWWVGRYTQHTDGLHTLLFVQRNLPLKPVVDAALYTMWIKEKVRYTHSTQSVWDETLVTTEMTIKRLNESQ